MYKYDPDRFENPVCGGLPHAVQDDAGQLVARFLFEYDARTFVTDMNQHFENHQE